ncbi:PIG-L family deacetylase [Thiococcus pfennigii]|uniref:PIG-L family deacetylase n=1 Tax=Thiococcus pfennigii TaxID=1057 RepID=UPI001907C8AD
MYDFDWRWRQLAVDGLLALNERLSVTASPEDVSSRSAIVFAPHPDDEVLGCGGVIALKAQAGTPIKVVVMTDGRASHRGFIDEDELVRMRRAEAKEAGVRLGLAASDYLFLDFEDHRLQLHRGAACDRVVDILGRHSPLEVYVPHRRDALADHVATNEIVRDAVERAKRPLMLFEYPVWLWNSWPWVRADAVRPGARGLFQVPKTVRDVTEVALGCRTRVRVGSVLARKRAALCAYRSQVERLNGSARWPTLSDVAHGDFLEIFYTGVEIFRRTSYPRTAARESR